MLIIWLLYIAIKLWQNPSINGIVGSCFNLQGWDLLKIKIWVKTWMQSGFFKNQSNNIPMIIIQCKWSKVLLYN
jgi:hypothetical protein